MRAMIQCSVGISACASVEKRTERSRRKGGKGAEYGDEGVLGSGKPSAVLHFLRLKNEKKNAVDGKKKK